MSSSTTENHAAENWTTGFQANEVSAAPHGARVAGQVFVPRGENQVDDPEACFMPRHGWYMAVKSLLDFLAALVLLVLLLPVIAAAALAVKLTSHGPAFYRQVRLGRGGASFTLIKLRTMVQNAEASTGAIWSQKNDARVTRLGKLLRDTHIDEFPQLLNVLQGHMSLVGPRPERPEMVSKLEWEIPCYRLRLNVKPGITGLAQLRLPADCNVESVRRKLVHDLYYVRFATPWLDAKLLAMTFLKFARQVARHAWQLVTLPSQDVIEDGFQRAVGVPHFALYAQPSSYGVEGPAEQSRPVAAG
jgi:lipopolysaccharide/colanic/teichoic acid biosynthesis glycosyltransferase